MLDLAVGVAVHADGVVHRREAAVETAIVEFAPLGCLEVVDEVLLALVADHVDE